MQWWINYLKCLSLSSYCATDTMDIAGRGKEGGGKGEGREREGRKKGEGREREGRGKGQGRDREGGGKGKF